jgi:hypothetical protein
MFMRIVLITLAVAGTLVAALGALLSVGVVFLVGMAILVVSLVMGAFAAPATQRGRYQPVSNPIDDTRRP